MAGNKGLWVNYSTEEIWEIDEHQTFLYTGNNHEKMGVPDWLWDKIKDKQDPSKRLAAIIQVMAGSPLMRVREHGNSCTFEFSNPDSEQPLRMIAKVAKYLGFGPFSELIIINFFTREEVFIKYADFEKKYDSVEKISQMAESIVLENPLPTLESLFESISNKTVKRIDLKIYGNGECQSIESKLLECVASDER
jgi:hypothetical protein